MKTPTIEQQPEVVSIPMKRTFLSLLLCFAIALSVSALNAQTMVGYLQQTRWTNPKVPISPGWVGQGTYSHFNLPGYGDVSVNVSPNNGGPVPQLSWGHETKAQFQQTSNHLLNWGTDTDFVLSSNTSNTTINYTITFWFNALSTPNPADLYLVVFGLARYTTATVAPGKGTNVGEYTLPLNMPTSPTVLNNGTFSSGWFNGSGTDPYNTGWDLYKPNLPKLNTLTLTVTQTSGDAIGFTLGYRVCPILVGNSLDEDYNIRHLYDINTTTGAATNPMVIGPDWHIGFSPFSPTGSLFGLQVNGDLFVVDPITGQKTLDEGTGYHTTFGGNLAADPTDPHPEVLYGVDGVSGQLFRLPPGGLVQTIGTVNDGYRIHAYSGMAFDRNGNLFIVDCLNGLLLTVNKTTAQVGPIKPLKFPSSLPPFSWGANAAGLAIDPSGTAYYTQMGANMNGDLYTLDLSNGNLSPIGPVTGAADSGILAGLTFIESLVDRSGACPLDYNGPPID